MNQLKLRSQFEAALANYKIASEAKELLTKMNLVLLSGPSAAGRNTIIEQLVKKGDYKYIVSDTTRKPRINNGIKEKNGITYWFRSEEELLDDLVKGNFLEAELIHKQQVSGISMRELRLAYQSNKIALSEVEIGGFNNILKISPTAKGILVLPPNFAVWIERLLKRNKMSPKEIKNRLETARLIFKAALNNSGRKIYIIINDDLERAVQLVDNIAHGGDRQEDVSPTKADQLAAQLLMETEQFLKDY